MNAQRIKRNINTNVAETRGAGTQKGPTGVTVKVATR